MSKHDIESLRLWFINTGDLYARHCELARSNAPTVAWYTHVVDALPRYRKEAGVWTNIDVLARIAVVDDLRAYYLQHIAEAATERPRMLPDCFTHGHDAVTVGDYTSCKRCGQTL